MDDNKAIEVLKSNVPKTCKMVNGNYQGGFDDWESEEKQQLKGIIDKMVDKINIWEEIMKDGIHPKNIKEFVEVDERKCEEVDNCFGVRIVDGKKYCRGCGNVQLTDIHDAALKELFS